MNTPGPLYIKFELRFVTYVPDIVLRGCVFRARDYVRPHARNHATFQNEIRDISYFSLVNFELSQRFLVTKL